MSPSGITSMKVRSKPRPCAHLTRSRASSSLKPFKATVLILIFSPAADAASMPARTTLKSPHRVTWRNFVRIERIKRDVDAPDAAIRKLRGKASELRAVGRDRHFVERSGAQVPGQAMEQRHHIAPDQRFAAGDANFSRAQADESRAQSIELFERQDVPLGKKVHVLGHAVDAPIVATVGDGDPHVGDRATKWVNERRNDRRRVNVHHARI